MGEQPRASECQLRQNVGVPRVGEWTHLALVFDGKTQRVFSQGTLIGEKECPAPGKLSKAREFIIGAEPGGDDNNSWNFGSGFLKSFRISSSARYTSDFTPASTLEADGDTTLLLTHTAVNEDKLRDQSKEENHAKLHGARLLSPKDVDSQLVKGKIVGPNGDPAKGVLVLLKRKQKTVAAIKTDQLGRYNVVLNNPEGKYGIEAGDWYRIVPGRWSSTMAGEVEDVTLRQDGESLPDLKLKSTPQDPMNELAFLVGEWENVAPNGNSQKAKFEWINNANFILATVGETKEIIGLDLETKRLTSWAFGSGGGYGRMQWTKLEDGWRVEATPRWWFAGGNTGKMWWAIKVISEEEVHLEGGMASGDEKESKWTIVSKKIQ